MFTGIPYYGTTYGGRPYHREMGETLEDMERAVKYQEAQEKASQTEYRGREMGEKPWEVPSRAQQQANYDRASSSYQTAPSRSSETRPREVGESPEEVAKNSKSQEPQDSRTREMTEQERRLDLFA